MLVSRVMSAMSTAPRISKCIYSERRMGRLELLCGRTPVLSAQCNHFNSTSSSYSESPSYSSSHFHRTRFMQIYEPMIWIQLLHTRSYTKSPASATKGEKTLEDKLRIRFPKASAITVVDISGGCGSMYEVHISTEDFRGLKTVAQHRLVTEALKSDIKNMHGLTIHTSST